MKRDAEIERLTRDLAECRRLLREAIAMLDTTDDSDQAHVYWLEAARKAAGGDDE